MNNVEEKLADLKRHRESIHVAALAFVADMPLTLESRRTFEQFEQTIESISEYENFLKKGKRK